METKDKQSQRLLFLISSKCWRNRVSTSCAVSASSTTLSSGQRLSPSGITTRSTVSPQLYFIPALSSSGIAKQLITSAYTSVTPPCTSSPADALPTTLSATEAPRTLLAVCGHLTTFRTHYKRALFIMQDFN